MSNITCFHVGNISNEILCDGAKYCLRKGDEVHCQNEVFEIPESQLDYHDTMFWVYLGVYIGLVLFAGEFYYPIRLCINILHVFNMSVIKHVIVLLCVKYSNAHILLFYVVFYNTAVSCV